MSQGRAVQRGSNPSSSVAFRCTPIPTILQCHSCMALRGALHADHRGSCCSPCYFRWFQRR